MSKFLAASAGLALAASALAGNSYNGTGFAIPDNAPAGANSVINVADSFSIANVSVTLNNLTHTWAGDLIATLSNGATTVTLVNRPGQVGGAGFGSSSDFGGNYTFADGGADLSANLGGGGTFVIPSGTYAPVGALSAFNGQNSAGAWTLNISDNAGGDLGNLGSWTLNLTAVPTPGAAALLGLAGVAGLRRRR